MAMLMPLGIEKGKPFQPDAGQTKILTEGAFVGEAMAKALAFDARVRGDALPFRRKLELLPLASTPCRTWRTTANSMNAQAISTGLSVTKAVMTKTPGIRPGVSRQLS